MQKKKRKNITQKELAEKLFVTDRVVSKWERNLSYPDIELLKEISEILDVSISELINGEEIEKINIEKEYPKEWNILTNLFNYNGIK